MKEERVKATRITRGKGVSRETEIPPANIDVERRVTVPVNTQAAFTAAAHRASADIAVCAIARRTGFMLRTLLTVWEGTLSDVEDGQYIRDAIEAAADALVRIYAEPEDDIKL